MSQIEQKIFSNLPEYLKTDVSVILVSLMRLGYYPSSVFGELNLMSKFTIFNKDQCLRILDCILENKITFKEHDVLTAQIIEKFV